MRRHGIEQAHEKIVENRRGRGGWVRVGCYMQDMSKTVASADARQGILFDDAPLLRPRTSDEKARAEMAEIVDALALAKKHPWSARLLGWKLRTFNVLAQRLTPIDAASLAARLDAELARLGDPED